MAGIIALLDQPRTLDALGRSTDAIIYFYYTGTTDLAPIYNDIGLTDPALNPVEVAAGQLFPDIYLDSDIVYRRRILYGDGTFYDVDPLPGTVSIDDSTYLPEPEGAVERSVVDKLDENISSKDFGAVIDGVTDDTDALEALFAYMAISGRANLLSGVYKVTRPLVIPPGTLEGGEVTLDFTDANPADFPNYNCVTVAGAAQTQIADIDTNLAIGDRTFSFASAHGLSAGDTFNLSGTVDYAGNGYRSYYRKGEMFRVAEVVDSTTVVTQGACRDTYPAADVEIWKRSQDTFTLKMGRLRILCPDTIRYGIDFQNLDQLSVDNLTVEGGDHTSISFENCFGVSGKSVYARQITNTFDGYGIGVFNSQEVRIWGTAHGYFNGFVVGGADPLSGKIGMNRDVHFEGVAASDATGGLSGANVHGNAEYCSFRGVFYNGVTLAGNWNEAHGTFMKATGGIPIIFGEMHGHSFKLSGEVLVTSGPDLSTSSGAIHMTGFGTASAAPGAPSTARYGGVTEIDLRYNVTKATRMVIWRPTNLTRTDVVLRLGLDIMAAHPSTRVIAMTPNDANLPVSLLQFTRFNVIDNGVAITWSMPNAASMKIRGLTFSKSVAISGTGTTATASATFSPAFPRIPTYSVSLASNVVIGGGAVRQIVGISGSPSASGCTAQISAVDGSSQTFDATVTVIGSLNEI